MKRTLSLRRESLSPLSNEDLYGVVGAVQALSRADGKCTLDNSYLLCTFDCYTHGATCWC